MTDDKLVEDLDKASNQNEVATLVPNGKVKPEIRRRLSAKARELLDAVAAECDKPVEPTPAKTPGGGGPK
jgi:predicted outer membrane protein